MLMTLAALRWRPLLYAQADAGHTNAGAMMIPTRVYVGNLPLSIRERDIEDLFHKVRSPLSRASMCPNYM